MNRAVTTWRAAFSVRVKALLAAPDAGSSTAEAAVVTPLLVGVLLFVVLCGRLVSAQMDLDAAASAAARAASIARTDPAAHADADRTARDTLTARGATCRQAAVTVSTGGLRPGGVVTVSVSCVVPLSDLTMLGVPGSRTVRASASSPIDTWRGNRVCDTAFRSATMTAERHARHREQRWTALRRLIERTGGDSGQVTPFALLMTVALVAVAGLVLDAGLALSEKVRALDLAQAAARAGAQALDLAKYRTSNVAELDPTRAAATARSWLVQAGADGHASATNTTVTVTVRRTSDTQLLQLVGVRVLHVTASATATAVKGVTGPGA